MYSHRAEALKRLCVVGIAFLVAWSTASIFGAVGSNERETYLVSLDDDTSPEVLRTIGTKVLVDYGNGFYLTESTESQALVLNRLGEVVKMKNSRMLDLYPSDVAFDTSRGPPATPSRMEDFGWDRETYIVQFVGPYRSEWLEAIEKEEGRIGKLAPTFSAVVKMSPSVKSKISQLPYVEWVGAYNPFYKISSELLERDGGVRISVMVFEESQRIDVSRKLVDFGASVLVSYPPRTIIAYSGSNILPWIVSMPEVLEVIEDFVSEPMDLMAGRISGAFESWNTGRSGLPSTLTGQSPGPDGIEGTADDIFEVVGIQDSGFDRCDPDNGHPDFFKGPNGDRVIRFVDQTGMSCPDGQIPGSAHGTHMAGAVMGNGFAWEYYLGESTDDDEWEHSEGVGIVPEGKLSFDGVMSFGGGLHANSAYWDLQYADGAHINVNGYGSQPTDYGGDSWMVDDRINVNNDRLIIFAAGNEGPDFDTLTGNTQGKNGLSAGASQNFRPNRPNAYNPNLVGEFSSRGGPSQGLGRLKPDLVTVGTQVIGPMGFGEWLYNEMTGVGNPSSDCIMQVDVYNHNDPDNLTGDGICDYRYFVAGTSPSTSHLSGLAMLVREYLREIGGINDPFQINSQLVKALMINGAVRMDESLYDYPGYDQGWGSVDLVQSLFPPAPRTNRYEEGVMSTTGVWNPTFDSIVDTDEVPLKVTLVWVDSPGRSLFRDLNLKATSPSGDVYYGNIYGKLGSLDGWSIPNPSPADANPFWDRVGNDGWDDVNNVEQIEVKFPEPGTWTIEVIGFSIPSDAPFALVASADFGPQDNYGVDLSTEHPLTVEAAPGGDVPFPFTVLNFGTGLDNIILTSAAPHGVIINFENQMLFGMEPRESIDTYAMISVASGVLCGSHRITITGTSVGDTSFSDMLEISLVVRCNKVPTHIKITNGTMNEMEPSVLTFNDGTTDHIFISYRKTTRISPDGRFGGMNVWLAHTTLDGEGLPALPFTHTEVSNWNDNPSDIRWTRIPQGSYQNRIIMTWVGDDPQPVDPELDSYGVLHFSDPPYNTWNRVVIERNAGSWLMNEARVNIPQWRDDGTPGGEFIWIWEHVDYVHPDANNPRAVQTWVAISRDGGLTFPICNGTHPDCKRITPNDNNYYFFPDSCVDNNDVLWVFLYSRLPASNDRDLMVRLYDGAWQGEDTPVYTKDDVSLLWNTHKTNVQWPTCLATTEGLAGNRVYVSVLNDMGGVDQTIWTGYLDGDYNSNNRPFGLNRTEDSGISPNLHGPFGPMGLSVYGSHAGRGPILNMVYTNDDWTWISYIENANAFEAPNLMAISSNDAFDTIKGYSILTDDLYSKGHQMTDSLTVNTTRHNVYEVFHMSRTVERDVNYDVYLLVYGKDWEIAPDTTGPEVDPIIALPNPFNVTMWRSTITLIAEVSDIYTGMSNISGAEWKEVPLSVTDPRLIDWTGANPMPIGNDSPTETGIVVWTPTMWKEGETHRLCARGQDEKGNWGIGACVDVHTIGKRPRRYQIDFDFTNPGWRLISVMPPRVDRLPRDVLGSIQGQYDQVRTYDERNGQWLSYIPGKPMQTLETIDDPIAFWIHITSAPATLTLDVNVSYTTKITLQPGWNLVAYPSVLADSVSVGHLLDNLDLNIDRVEGFDGTNSPYYLKELNPSYYLKPGEGYWMHVSGDRPVIWSVVGF
jgi:hypothetical protein